MRITAVEAVHLRLPRIEAELCNGTQDAFVVRVHTDSGITGLGEADSSPHIMKAIVEAPTSHAICHGLAAAVVGEDPVEIGRLWQKMYRASVYYGRAGAALQAISAIDIALWDIVGQATGQPVYKLLSGLHHPQVQTYASMLMPETPAEVEAKVGAAAAAGFDAVKLGWGPLGQSPERDHELIGVARQVLGSGGRLMLDYGWAWDAATAVRRVRELAERFDPFWVEEPLFCDDLEGYARLCAGVDTRIAAGEEDTTLAGFRSLLDIGVAVLQPDVSRAGGLTACMRVAALAAERGVLCVPHAFSTGILRSASLHFAAAIPNGGLMEWCVDGSPLSDNLVHLPVPPGAVVRPPVLPGLGLTLDESALNRYRVE